jgi:fibronectin-binding autotransporter adhesin
MATRNWVVPNAGTYSFNSPANWAFGIVPGAADIAQFNTSAGYTVTGNGTIAELLVNLGQVSLTGSYTISGAQPTEISVAPSGANAADLVIEQGARVAGNEAVSLSGDAATLEIAGTLIASTVSVGNGNLYIDGGSAFDVFGPITLSDQGLLRAQPAPSATAGAPVPIANAIQTAGTDYLISAGGQELELNGVISGSGLLELSGDLQADTIALNGNNTYTGGTTIGTANLTVEVGNANAFGTGALTISAGELLGTTTEAISSPSSMTIEGNSTIAAAPGQTLTISPTALTFDASSITIGASGQNGIVQFKLSSSAAISNSGAYSVTIQDGTLKALDIDTYLVLANDTTTTIASGATLDVDGESLTVNGLEGSGSLVDSESAGTATLTVDNGNFSGTISGAIALAVSGTLTLTGGNSYTGGTTINTGAKLTLGNDGTTGSVAGSIADSGTLAIDQSGSFALNNVSGAGTLVQEGTGTTILGGGLSYTGGTTISAGTLSVGSASALGTGALTVDDGELLGSASEMISSPTSMTIEGNSTIAAAAGQTLTISPTALTFDASSIAFGASGQNGIVQFKLSSSAAISNPGAYSVTIQDGTLKALDIDTYLVLANDTTTTIASGATLDVDDESLTVNGLEGGGSVVDSGGAAGLSVDNGNFGGTVSGAIALSVGGTLTLTGSNTYTGGTTISSGTELILGNGGTIGSVAGSITDSGTLAIDQSGSFALNNASGAGKVVQEGSGTTILGSGLSYTGGTTIDGGTVSVGNASALGTGALNVDGGELLGGATETISGPSATTIEGNSTIAAAAGQTLTIDTAGLTFDASSITIGAPGQAGIVQFKISSSVSTSDPGDYSVTVQAGTLKALDISAEILLDNDNATTIAAAATLDMGGEALLLNGLQGDGSVVDSGVAATLVVDNGDFGGTISGPIALTVEGDLALTGSDTNTGGTTIASGAELTLGNGGSTGSITGNIADNGALEFRLTGTSVESGTISGAGNLVQDGGGTTVLTAANSYSGGTLLAGGIVEMQKPNSAGSGAITLLSGAINTLRFDGTTMPVNQILGFEPGDRIDLPNLVFNTSSYSGGVLTLSENGVSVGQLNLATTGGEDFVLGPDGEGGTMITSAPVNSDFNGDGKTDILWENASSGDVVLWNSNGSGGFTYENLGAVNTSWQIAETGDFNGDGEDILWRNTNGDTELWNSNGSGGFTYENLGAVNTSWQIAGTGDFTGNGESGILWRNTDGDTELWNPNGYGGFTYQNLGDVSTSWQIAGADDFTGTGEDGILWRNANGDTELWNPNGSGGFTYQNLGDVSTSWQIVGTGDFSGTGQSGILWQNSNGATELWNPNGSGGFTYQNLGVHSGWQIEGTGDFNGNGEDGILWQNASSGDVVLWNSNGSGGFSGQDLGVQSGWTVHKSFG